MTTQGATASRAARGGRPGPPRPEPIASRRSSIARSAERTEGAAHPALVATSRGHTAHDADAATQIGEALRAKRPKKSRRFHMFIGERSICGKAAQRPIVGVQVDCGTCLRVARKILNRWIEERSAADGK